MFRSVKKEEITIPAQMSYLLQVRNFIEHIGKRYKYSEKMVNSFKLVIDEACTNIIRHGYRDIKNGEIQLKAIMRRLSLTIVVVDQGTSYDPRQANTPDLAKYVDIGKKGGLGILMMRKLMDDIQYVVTEKGNEFRLTKMREATDEPKLMQMWHALNMRTRYSLISSFIFTLIVTIIFGLLFVNLKNNVDEEVFTAVSTSTRSLAENSVFDMDTYLPLFDNIKSVMTSTEIEIHKAFILDSQNNIKASISGNEETEYRGNFQLPENAVMADSSEFAIIYKYSVNDSLDIYDAVSEISEKSDVQNPTLLGEAHIWVSKSSIDEIVTDRRITLIIVLVIILIIGYTGSFYLVSQILKSFHSLADWVRQVVRGKVDQDEIDIDTSDEIGEIAQAFNEMTQKFQKAQVNLIEQQKMQKELQVAQEIQQMLLPSDFPEVEGFDIGSYYEAAKEVGGDLFDFVEVDEETVGIVVADVSGKGVPGSLIMTMIRTAIRLESRGNKNPADVLARVNRFVSNDMRKGMFVTMFYIILDSRNRVIHYASAGHNPMMLFRSSSKQTYYLNPSGFPVGIQLPDINLFDKRIETDSIRLREDDILVLYTDGITEAMNHQRELYREERFLQSIRDNGHLDVAEFVKSIKDDLKNYTGGAPQNDDITFVAVKEKLMAGEIIYKTHKHVVDLIADGMRVKDACEKLKISQYQYYKYKGIVDEGGLDALKEFLDGSDHIEKKHISIEVKSKIFDIIRSNPRHGAKKISSLLNTEKYGFVELEERRIYNDLIKQRLNTQKLRQRFVEKGQNKRLKQPGTPLLTLDGKVILDFDSSENEIAKRTGTAPQQSQATREVRQEEKKPFVREISNKKDDSALIMHQTGKIYDPAKESAKKEPETKEETPAQVEKIKKEPKQKPEIVQKKEVEQISVPTKEELTKKATEKIDHKLVDKLYFECKDDFDAVERQINIMKAESVTIEKVKKMNLILKIVLKNPILKKLREVKQLFSQGQSILELLEDNFSAIENKSILEKSETVLNYLKKENILNTSTSIIENINVLGLIHKKLEINSPQKEKKINSLDSIRNKIVKKQLVSDASILKSLDENPKS
ncbi:MAG: HAMP domain-containing protein [Calditrichaeota bacterium]|nr:MAG: HAMP domain-containing protein [Calditrichota bacterium]MBL1205966.1 HAMP domain-containing protein [Calditrichota bacterium]NOG45794.1 SpoIIE family protein phosphatase [Calditrichota bacterium]